MSESQESETERVTRLLRRWAGLPAASIDLNAASPGTGWSSGSSRRHWT